MRNYDFCGWATKNDLKCSDGRVIRKDAFKECDGTTVPLVWNHQHNEAYNVLGHAELENRPEGVFAYGSFNDSESGKQAKELVKHGDITMLSIYANQLKQVGSDVIHGAIREVSLVLAGANRGATIESFFEHSADDDYDDDEAVICTGDDISIYHSDDSEATDQREDKPEHKEENKMAEKTVKDVFDTMNEEQKDVVSYALNQIKDIDSEKIITFCNGLSKVVLALSASMLVLGVLALVPGGLLAGVLGLVAMVGAIGLIIAAFAGLSKIKGFTEFMSGGAATIGKIIGSFQGAMQAAKFDSLSKGLSSLSGSDVNNEKVKSALEAAQAVADFAGGFPAMTIEESIATAIAGDTPFGLFCKNLQTFATSIQSLQVGLNAIDDETAQKAKLAVDTVKPIATFANSFPKFTIEDTIAIAIAGDTPFGLFCKNMGDFATSLLALKPGLDAVTPELSAKSQMAIDAVKPIATFANSFPKFTIEDSVANAIAGGTPFAVFCANMGDFATSIQTLIDNTVSLSVQKLNTLGAKTNGMVDAAIPIVTLANSFPKFTIEDSVANAIAGGTPFAVFCTNMGDFATSVSTLKTNLSGISGTNIEADTETALNAAKQIADFASALNSDEYNIEANKGAIEAWFTGDTKANTVIDQIADLGEAIGGKDGLQAKIASLADTTVEADTTTLTTVLGSIATALGAINANMNLDSGDISTPEFETKIDKFLTQIERLGGSITTFSTSIDEIDNTKVSGIISAVASLGQAMAAVSGMDNTSNFDHVIEQMKNLFSGDWMENTDTSTATKAITAVCTAMVGAITGYKARFQIVGANIVQGLADGIRNNAWKARQAAIKVMDMAIRAAKTRAGIASPSKEFAKIGMYSDLGFAEGLTKYSGFVSKASKDVAATMLDTAKGGLSTLNSLIEDGMDGDPVVRPVVDLADVQNGARAINGMLGNHPSINAKASIDNVSTVASSMTNTKRNQNGSKTVQKESAVSSADNSVNLSGNNFYVRSEEDIHSLASEIASLTRQQQRAFGAS